MENFATLYATIIATLGIKENDILVKAYLERKEITFKQLIVTMVGKNQVWSDLKLEASKYYIEKMDAQIIAKCKEFETLRQELPECSTTELINKLRKMQKIAFFFKSAEEKMNGVLGQFTDEELESVDLPRSI